MRTRVIELVGLDAVAGQHGSDRLDHPGRGDEERIVFALELRTSRSAIAPRVHFLFRTVRFG